MVENVEKKDSKNVEKSKSYRGVGLIIALLAIGGIGAYLWYQNPEIFSKIDSNKEESALAQNLQSQINALNLKIKDLEKTVNEQAKTSDLAMLNDKMNTSLRFNEQILNAKADTAAVLGLMNRVDNLETNIKNLGRVSSQGALILTAAMLVKDTAYKGAFNYEAEVLRTLAYGTSMQNAAEDIYNLSSNKILCKRKLTKLFNSLFDNMQKNTVQEDVKEIEVKEEPENWKEKINSKLKELVIIEKHQDKTLELKQKAEDEVYKLVNEGYFSLAIEKMKLNEAYNTENFKVWEEQVLRQENFEQALSQIEALTLAFMKAESLKNK